LLTINTFGVTDVSVGEMDVLEGSVVGESVTAGVSETVGVVAGSQAAKNANRMSITTRTEKFEKGFVFMG
jgi:hypothetical protein